MHAPNERTVSGASCAKAGASAASTDWWTQLWAALSHEERERLRDKAKWEHVSLMAVLIDWHSLVPEEVRHLIPAPDRAA